MADDFEAGIRKLMRDAPRLVAEAVEMTMQAAEVLAKQTDAFQDRTGNLRNSIKGGVMDVSRSEVIGVLTAGMEYAGYIELGTSRMSPRPYIRPAVEQVVAMGVFERALRARLGGFG